MGIKRSTRSGFRVYQSAAQTPAASTWTKVNFQTKVYDYANEFDTTSMNFTAKTSGIYSLSAGVAPNSPGAGMRMIAGIYVGTVNGAAGNGYRIEDDLTGGAAFQCAGSIILPMSAGDIAFVETLEGSSTALQAVSNITYFMGYKVANL